PISYTRCVVSQSLTDCFVESGCGLGLSFNQKGFNFRIDHIMCSQHFTPYNCTVDANMDASDHNPIICWLEKQ
ncbi:MAG: AP endonuclease, partial [Prevotella sp.]|nr:AP endonuclease [Prevotella sp.]